MNTVLTPPLLALQDFGLANLEKLEATLPSLADVVATQDKNEILYKQQELLRYVGNVEESMLKEFPFEIPAEYNDLPQLKVPLSDITLDQRSYSSAQFYGAKQGRLQIFCFIMLLYNAQFHIVQHNHDKTELQCA